MKIRSTNIRTPEKQQIAADAALHHLLHTQRNLRPVKPMYIKAIALMFQVNEQDLAAAFNETMGVER